MHSNELFYWWWDKFFTQEQINTIVDFIEKEYVALEEEHLKASGKQVSNVKVIPYKKVKSLLAEVVDVAFQNANIKFGYHTFNPSLDEGLILNTYTSDSKDTYDWHFDSSKSDLYDMKCTLIINASTDEYEGGEFKIFAGGELGVDVLDNTGSVILLKSFINHKVLPVTKGTRKSLVMFISGNKFQ